MNAATQDFLTKFSSLTGTTIGEKHHSLYKLLNEIKSKNSEIDFYCIQPQSLLEAKFKIEALIVLRKSADVMEFLKSENYIHIAKLLKVSPWLIAEQFKNISPLELVLDIFPNISVNTKIKLLHKLAIHLADPGTADGYFKEIREKYGLYLALKLLPACSTGLIMNYILAKVIPTPKQLLLIIRRNPSLTDIILLNLKNNTSNVEEKYKSVFLFIGRKYPILFAQLVQHFNLTLCLGWRATQKFIRNNKQLVLQSPHLFYKLLHNKQLLKNVKADFPTFFLNYFPKTHTQLLNQYDHILSIVEKTNNLDLFFTTFQIVFDKSLWDCPTFVRVKLLEMLPPDQRVSKLKSQYKPDDFSEAQWNCYLSTDNSIPYLKTMISLSSDKKSRSKLMKCLVETCRINKNSSALLSVCKYVLHKHRNDNVMIRGTFLTALGNYGLDKLTDEHWQIVKDLIALFSLNEETFYDQTAFQEAFIRFLFKNGLPVEDALTDWLTNTHHMYFDSLLKNAKFQKECLLKIGEILPIKFTDNRLDLYSLTFLLSIIEWNRHNEDKISIFDYQFAMETMTKLLKNEKCLFRGEVPVNYIICQRTTSAERKILLNLYFKPENKYGDTNVLRWLLQNEPTIIAENIEAVVSIVLQTETPSKVIFWKKCNDYNHLEIPQKIIKVCLKLFENDDLQKKKNIIYAFSDLMKLEEFQSFITSYYPQELKIDLKSKDNEKMYALRKTVGASLKNVTSPSLVFKNLLAFCKGDYFKLVCVSLYALSANSNEEHLLELINTLAENAVSIRKHAIHLVFIESSKTHIYAVLNRFMKSEKNSSIRSHIVKGIFKFFSANPDDYSWKLLQTNVLALDLNDKETFNILLQVNKIPLKYCSQYVQFLWNICNAQTNNESLVKSRKANLINLIPSTVVSALPLTFCKIILVDHLFIDDFERMQNAVQSFAAKFIIYCSSDNDQNANLKSVFDILKNFVNETDLDIHTKAARHKSISNFIETICAELLINREINEVILDKIIQHWVTSFQPHENFESYLYLHFLAIAIKKFNYFVKSQKIGVFCEGLICIYGYYLVDLVSAKLKTVLKYFLKPDEYGDTQRDFYVFVEEFLKCNFSIPNLILLVLLLDSNLPTRSDTKQKYYNVIRILQTRPENVLHLYLNMHLQKNIKRN